MSDAHAWRPRVGLFVTCLVDLFRPSVGFAAAKLLALADCEVIVPEAQTAFDGLDYVVAPSGSCAGMLKHHYPHLLQDDAEWHGRAIAFAERVFELTSFLVDVRGLKKVPGAVKVRATYHDSCSGLRELGVKRQPRALLQMVAGLELIEMEENETCCGFGGTFSIKYPDISNAMVAAKAKNIEAREPDLLLAGDLGCLMNMAGKLKRSGSRVVVRHVAEVLAGELDDPPIAQAL